MINSPKDLDQSDVNADAARMYEEEMERIADTLDPLDIYTVCAMIADASGDDLEIFLNSAQGRDLIRYSQSDPSGAHEKILRLAELDDALGNL